MKSFWNKILEKCNESGVLCEIFGHKWKKIQNKTKYTHKIDWMCEM